MNSERNVMNPEVKQQWVAALRSGEYEQGHNQLKIEPPQFVINSPQYCCLGVLCEISNLPYDPNGGFPPSEVQEWAGLSYVYCGHRIEYRKNALDNLVMMNDDDEADFDEIADWIEANL